MRRARGVTPRRRMDTSPSVRLTLRATVANGCSIVSELSCRDNVPDPPQLLGSRQVEITTDERRVAHGLDLAHDVHIRVLGIDAHEDIPQVRPHEPVGAAHEVQVLVGGIDPVRPMIIG